MSNEARRLAQVEALTAQMAQLRPAALRAGDRLQQEFPPAHRGNKKMCADSERLAKEAYAADPDIAAYFAAVEALKLVWREPKE